MPFDGRELFSLRTVQEIGSRHSRRFFSHEFPPTSLTAVHAEKKQPLKRVGPVFSALRTQEKRKMYQAQGGLLMQRFIVRPIMPSALVGLVGLLSAPRIYAQVDNRPPAGKQLTQQSQPQKNVSDKELHAFVKAYVEV